MNKWELIPSLRDSGLKWREIAKMLNYSISGIKRYDKPRRHTLRYRTNDFWVFRDLYYGSRLNMVQIEARTGIPKNTQKFWRNLLKKAGYTDPSLPKIYGQESYALGLGAIRPPSEAQTPVNTGTSGVSAS